MTKNFRRDVLKENSLQKNWSDVQMKEPDGEQKTFVRPEDKLEKHWRDELERVNAEAWKMLNNIFSMNSSFTHEDEKEYGLEYISDGCYRNVYFPKEDTKIPFDNPEELVVKEIKKHASAGVGVLDCSQWANEEEVKGWVRLKDTPIGEYLAPVIDFGEDFDWVVQRRADNSGVSRNEMNEIRDECTDLGWEYEDWATRNVGYVDDELVLVDYGHKHTIGEELMAD